MEISDIKQQLTIETILNHYGLQVDKNGMLCCPFHEDKTPSLQVYPKTNTFCCFSSNCTAGTGDVIQFIELKEKCSKHQAILKAKELLGVKEAPKALGKIALLTKVYQYFEKGLYSSASAKTYLEQRHLKEIIGSPSYGVGYHSGQYHHRENKYLIESSVQHGLLKPNPSGGYFVFGKGCICFALRNKSNQITGLYFRSISEKKQSKHFYLKDREGLYPSYPKAETKKLILTEAIIDAATLLQQKSITEHYEILSLFGTNGLTDEHIEAIRSLKQLEEIIFFFDGDAAGTKAAEKYSKELHQLKPEIQISKVETPQGEDINSLLDGHSAEILSELIQNRTPFIFSTDGEPPQAIKLESEEQLMPIASPTYQLNTTNPERIHYQNEHLQITVWGGIEKENLSRLRVSLHIKPVESCEAGAEGYSTGLKSKENKYKTFRDDVNLYSHTAVKKTHPKRKRNLRSTQHPNR